MPEVLFNTTDFAMYQSDRIAEVERTVATIKAQLFKNNNDEVLFRDHLTKFIPRAISVALEPRLLPVEEVVIDNVSHAKFVFEADYQGSKELFFVRPSTFSSMLPRVGIIRASSENGGVLLFDYVGMPDKRDEFLNGVRAALGQIAQYCEWQRPSTARLELDLKEKGLAALATRRSFLTRIDELNS